jgi:tRNA G18 (ribose-2'-O)-methylase SpoU
VGLVAHARLTPLRVERVASAEDPRLDGFRRLPEATLRRGDVFVAESREVVRQLLAGGRYRLRSLLTTQTALDDLADALAGAGTAEILVADGALLRAVAGYAFHRGCMALVARGPEPSLDALLAALGAGSARLLLVDDVVDPDNVGALFRNAAAFGVAAVLLTERSADPLYRKTIRVSMGHTLRLPWARLAAWPDTASRLAAHGFTLAALTPDGGDLEAFAPTAPARLALVVGNEGSGVTPAALAVCGARLAVRMAPGVDSLNVATATAIALHRVAGVGPRSPH